ncbi:MAG: ATP-dependent zinc metalloprotease FtsH [Sphingobacteriia bacterium]|nr:ATP-dependent zinc metalloprotease FtsH [Sphingobacteriia bacterium]
MGNFGKNLLVWAFVILTLLGIYNYIQGGSITGTYSTYPFSDFLSKVEEGQVASVLIQGRNIEGKFTDGTRFNTFLPEYPNLIDKLRTNSVRIEAVPTDSKMNSVIGILLSWFPIFLLIGVWVFFMKQMQGGGGKAMGFGKSRAKLLSEKSKITFEDVAGIDEAKEELTEIVDFLKDPGKFQSLGGKIPKGCLLIGQPGTGKTLLARAIAGEANVPFFSISGSDFVEMFVGVGASRVRDMFEQGKKNAPCIIFIDEIDAVGRHRGIGLGGGNDEREQTLNQLLVEMDGFEANEGVIILAATNRPDVLDPALLRPGRFDRQIVVPAPDINGREQILSVHARKVPVAPDVDLKVIARGTPGFSGADLANIVNEGALMAARKNRKIVTMKDFEAAKDKVMMGVERKSMAMTEDQKKLTAYHEGGHAIVALHCPASDPIHKATIIPRGRALGLVMRLPETDRYNVTLEKLKADISVAMGGRVAEELIFGKEKITSGASSDIEQATKMARAMVTEWGMSDKVGPIHYGGEGQDVYLGHSTGSQKSRSDDTTKLIDDEIKKFVDDGYKSATKILKDNLDKLHLLANALLEYETLSGDEIKDILAGKKIKRDHNDDKPKRSSLATSSSDTASSDNIDTNFGQQSST